MPRDATTTSCLVLLAALALVSLCQQAAAGQAVKRSVNFTPSWGKRGDHFKGETAKQQEQEDAGLLQELLMGEEARAASPAGWAEVGLRRLEGLGRCEGRQATVEAVAQRLRSEINSLEDCLRFSTMTHNRR